MVSQRPNPNDEVAERRAKVIQSYIRARRRLLEILARLDREYEGWQASLSAEQYQALLDLDNPGHEPSPMDRPTTHVSSADERQSRAS